jgi:hypothetical protein
MVMTEQAQSAESAPEVSQNVVATRASRTWVVAIILAVIAAVVFFKSSKPNQEHFDYTFRIAGALLHGHVGLETRPPSWLNEMVPLEGHFYSVFPLGAVLTMIPVAILQRAGWIQNFPGHWIAAIIVACVVYFSLRLTEIRSQTFARRIAFALFPIFGTWAWCNLGFGGAWQLALGFALLGEIASLYFLLVRPCPFLSGIFLALAVGNRTELVLTVPFYLYFVWRDAAGNDAQNWAKVLRSLPKSCPALVWFLSVPIILGASTGAYNLARFHSIFDFGYAHIPNLMREPWYQRGLFSIHAIPWNMQKSLFEGFNDYPHFPFIRFYPFGCSIFLSSPFLFLLFREGGQFKTGIWFIIGAITFVLWCHGNPGGWQFSYRYAMVLLPWMLLLIMSNGPAKMSAIELSLFSVSVAINATATYQFLWTNLIHP